MKQLSLKNLFFGLIILLFTSCEGEEGPIGPSGLINLLNITIEPVGNNCLNGGFKVEVGIDENSSGSLENEEIRTTSYVCNGVDANSSFTSVNTEPVGENCPNGGIKIDSGVDANGDGTLEEAEITTTTYVCNGVDGNNSLIRVTGEAAGINCENGGIKIDTGLDTNRDGTLEDSEITSSSYICNGVNGNNSLTKITNEAAGENCAIGGIMIDVGVDANRNGMLDEDEIEMTRFICNGIDGAVDEQIRLVIFPSSFRRVTSTTGILLGELIEFDIGNYPGIDSAVFTARIRSLESTTNAIAELYNSTDEVVIDNSTVMTNSISDVTVFSGNIYDDLPSQKVNLNVRLRSEADGTAVINGKAYLFLYRSN